MARTLGRGWLESARGPNSVWAQASPDGGIDAARGPDHDPGETSRGDALEFAHSGSAPGRLQKTIPRIWKARGCLTSSPTSAPWQEGLTRLEFHRCNRYITVPLRLGPCSKTSHGSKPKYRSHKSTELDPPDTDSTFKKQSGRFFRKPCVCNDQINSI